MLCRESFLGNSSLTKAFSLMSDQRKTQIKEIGKFCPEQVPMESLQEGEVGYVVTGIRDVAEIKIGDTLTISDDPAEEMLPGYKRSTPHGF